MFKSEQCLCGVHQSSIWAFASSPWASDHDSEVVRGFQAGRGGRLLPTLPLSAQARAVPPCVWQPGGAKALTSPCPELPEQQIPRSERPLPSCRCAAVVGGRTPAWQRKVWGRPDPRHPPPHWLRLGVGGEAAREDQRAWPWAWATTSEEARSALGGQPECPLRLPVGATREVSPAAAGAARPRDGHRSVDGVLGAFTDFPPVFQMCYLQGKAIIFVLKHRPPSLASQVHLEFHKMFRQGRGRGRCRNGLVAEAQLAPSSCVCVVRRVRSQNLCRSETCVRFSYTVAKV